MGNPWLFPWEKKLCDNAEIIIDKNFIIGKALSFKIDKNFIIGKAKRFLLRMYLVLSFFRYHLFLKVIVVIEVLYFLE